MISALVVHRMMATHATHATLLKPTGHGRWGLGGCGRFSREKASDFQTISTAFRAYKCVRPTRWRVFRCRVLWGGPSPSDRWADVGPDSIDIPGRLYTNYNAYIQLVSAECPLWNMTCLFQAYLIWFIVYLKSQEVLAEETGALTFHRFEKEEKRKLSR